MLSSTTTHRMGIDMLDLDRLDTDPTYRTAAATRTTATDATLDRMRRVANESVPAAARKFEREMTPGQGRYIMVLLRQLRDHNPAVYATANPWIAERINTMTFAQASKTIDRLKNNLAGPAGDHAPEPTTRPTGPIPLPTDGITDGNYAYTDADGKNHFIRITTTQRGRYAGQLKIQERASEELFLVTRVGHKRAILNAIRAIGVDASHMLYATLLKRCWHCHTALTDNTNPYHTYGLGPICGPKVRG